MTDTMAPEAMPSEVLPGLPVAGESGAADVSAAPPTAPTLLAWLLQPAHDRLARLRSDRQRKRQHNQELDVLRRIADTPTHMLPASAAQRRFSTQLSVPPADLDEHRDQQAVQNAIEIDGAYWKARVKGEGEGATSASLGEEAALAAVDQGADSEGQLTGQLEGATQVAVARVTFDEGNALRAQRSQAARSVRAPTRSSTKVRDSDSHGPTATPHLDAGRSRNSRPYAGPRAGFGAGQDVDGGRELDDMFTTQDLAQRDSHLTRHSSTLPPAALIAARAPAPPAVRLVRLPPPLPLPGSDSS